MLWSMSCSCLTISPSRAWSVMVPRSSSSAALADLVSWDAPATLSVAETTSRTALTMGESSHTIGRSTGPTRRATRSASRIA